MRETEWHKTQLILQGGQEKVTNNVPGPSCLLPTPWFLYQCIPRGVWRPVWWHWLVLSTGLGCCGVVYIGSEQGWLTDTIRKRPAASLCLSQIRNTKAAALFKAAKGTWRTCNDAITPYHLGILIVYDVHTEVRLWQTFTGFALANYLDNILLCTPCAGKQKKKQSYPLWLRASCPHTGRQPRCLLITLNIYIAFQVFKTLCTPQLVVSLPTTL